MSVFLPVESFFYHWFLAEYLHLDWSWFVWMFLPTDTRLAGLSLVLLLTFNYHKKMSDHMKRDPNARHTCEGGKGNKQEAIKSTIQERSNNTRQIIKTRERPKQKRKPGKHEDWRERQTLWRTNRWSDEEIKEQIDFMHKGGKDNTTGETHQTITKAGNGAWDVTNGDITSK